MSPSSLDVSIPPMPDVSLTYTQDSTTPPILSAETSQDAIDIVDYYKPLLRIPTIGIKSKTRQSSKLFDLPVKALIHICHFLKLRDFIHLTCSCRHTRLLFTLDTRYNTQIGKDLVGNILLHGGLDAWDRHRFLAQCIGWDHSFLLSISRELEIRSANTDIENGRIRFLQPFRGAGLSSKFTKPCNLAKVIRRTLLQSPPHTLLRRKESLLTFLLEDSSSSPSNDGSDSEDRSRPRSQTQDGILWNTLADDIRATHESPTQKSEHHEWCRMFELASLLSGETDHLCLESQSHNVLLHHSCLADGIFEYLCDPACVAIDESLDDEIRRDINRTLPSHLLFRLDAEAELKSALFRVLRAVAVLEPGMGYCQGMNFIVGVLLIETLCPETSFYTLMGMIRNFQFSGLYCPGLPSLKMKLKQFEEVARSHVSSGFRHLLRLGLQTDLIGHQCFVTAFSYYLHASVLIRILDSFFVTGWRLFHSLGLVMFKMMEPEFEKVEDAEGALKVLQNFRLATSKISLDTQAGTKLFSRIVREIRRILPLITNERLADLGVKQFIRTLRAAIAQMELPLSHHKSASNQKKNVPPSPAENQAPTPPSPSSEEKMKFNYPFLLVPRFPDRSIWKVGRRPISWDGSHDFPAIIVNYVTLKNSRYFQIIPLENVKENQAPMEETVPSTTASSIANDSQKPAKISWCLLASQSTAASEATKTAPMTLVRGKGALPLNGFYVIVDGRQVLGGELETRFFRFRAKQSQEYFEDPLMRHLFPPVVDVVHERAITSTLQNGTLPEIYNLTESLARHETLSREIKSRYNDIDDGDRKYQKEASELLQWIRSHNTADVDATCKISRSVSHGGFVVIPLRAIIQTKLQLDALVQQLTDDKQTFEGKISSTERQLQSKLKEVDKLKAKKRTILEIVDQLEDEKKRLIQRLHGAVTSPKNIVQRHAMTMSDGAVLSRMYTAQSTSRAVTPDFKTRSDALESKTPNRNAENSIWGKVTSIFRRPQETSTPPSPSAASRRSSRHSMSRDEDEYSLRSQSSGHLRKASTESAAASLKDNMEDMCLTRSGDGPIRASTEERRSLREATQVPPDSNAGENDPVEIGTADSRASRNKSVKFDPVAAEVVFTSPCMSESELRVTQTVTSPVDYTPPTSPAEPAAKQIAVVERVVMEDGQQKTIRKLERRLKMVESVYSRNKTRLTELNRKLSILEEGAREAFEIKAALVQSHYELAARQEEEELEVIRQTLRTTSDWGVDPLPYQLLKIAGIVSEDSVSVALLNDIPDLYSELISLPPFWPQFKSLFLVHSH